MYELIQVSNNSYYVNCPAKIGVYRCEDDSVYFIDSGNDKEAGRRLRQLLDRNGWRLRAILNTHSNADHIGGNRYLQTQTGCKIFAPGIEADFTRHPVLEPAFLYGGYPSSALRHKFLLAQESCAVDITSPDFPKEAEVLPLPGHFFDMVGYRMPDGVCFMADCVSSAETLEKYRVGYIYDVKAYLQTLDYIESLKAPIFIPSHTEPVTDMRELAELNRSVVLEIIDRLLDICSEPVCFETVLQRIFNDFGLSMNLDQYCLVGNTVKSYLSYLKDSGRVNIIFKDNLLLWSSAI
ncbi:MAG: MBL fold metallo-hydrolase [Oscillospiraceae bacterium]|nr:MBL fold metallo-hydrolase [Oscillospiraceae bacterium]